MRHQASAGATRHHGAAAAINIAGKTAERKYRETMASVCNSAAIRKSAAKEKQSAKAAIKRRKRENISKCAIISVWRAVVTSIRKKQNDEKSAAKQKESVSMAAAIKK